MTDRDGAGAEFGPYVLLALIGRGGMGEVWRARDTVRGREVALKRISGAPSADPELRERFRRESRLVARLSSRHVIPIHDFGEIEGRLYLDMRLVPGPDLRGVLDRHPDGLATGVVGDVVAQVAAALTDAHGAGLVHRDIKPSNVLVDATGDRWFCYLADFGVAVPAVPETEWRITRTGVTVGTPAYMAPELFLDDGRASVASDVYALGCLAHELLTGRPPYTGPNHASVLYQHVHAEPPRVSGSRPVPAAVDGVLGTALAKDPSRRYDTAADLGRALSTALADAPPGPGSPVTGGGRVRRRRTRRRWFAGGAAAVAVVLAGTLVAIGRDAPPVIPAAPATAIVRTVLDVRYTHAVAALPDGRTALVVGEDAQGPTLFGVDVGTGQIVSRTAVDPNAYHLVASPDGRRAYLPVAGPEEAPGRRLQVVDVPTARLVADVALGGRPADAVASPDGTRLYVAVGGPPGEPGSVVVLDTARNVVVQRIPIGVAPLGAAVSPDGRTLYVTATGTASGAEVSVVDLPSARVVRTVAVRAGANEVVASPDGARIYVATSAGDSPSTLDVVDTSTFSTVQSSASSTAHVVDMTITPDGGRLLVANYGTPSVPDQRVAVLRTDGTDALPPVPTGGRPRSIAVAADGRRALVVTEYPWSELLVVTLP